LRPRLATYKNLLYNKGNSNKDYFVKSALILFALIASVSFSAQAKDEGVFMSNPFFYEPTVAVGAGLELFTGSPDNQYSNTGTETIGNLQVKGYLLGFGLKGAGGVRLLGVGAALSSDKISVIVSPASFFIGRILVGPDFYVGQEATHTGISVSYSF
jgi:hypothetical protein